MRITGRYGSGGEQSATGGKDRSDPEAFRRGRKVGQIVRGRLVAPGPGGLFWVVLAGHKLLASLDHEPIPGRELVFRIERLEPELMLRDITPPPSAASDPVLLLAALTEARSRFEHLLPAAAAPTAPPLDLTAARKRFAAFLAAHPEAGTALDAVRELFRLASRLLPAGEGRLIYAPWVFPGLTQSEVLVTPRSRDSGDPGFALRLFGRLPGPGLVLVQASIRPGNAAYRLLSEKPETAAAAIDALAEVRFGHATITPHCLFSGPLAESQAGGIVAPMLARAARPFTGLRLRV